MRNTHQTWLGILTTVVSSSMVLGSIMLSLVEGGYRLAPSVTKTNVAINVYITPTLAPTLMSALVALSPTLHQLSSPTLMATNTRSPIPSTFPPHTPALCVPPTGWVIYQVQTGDTLSQISQAVGVLVATLQLANCLGYSSLIWAGQHLYVPYLPPQPMATIAPSLTPTASSVNTLPPAINPTMQPTLIPTWSGIPTTTPTQNPPMINPTATPTPTATSPSINPDTTKGNPSSTVISLPIATATYVPANHLPLDNTSPLTLVTLPLMIT